MKLITWNCQGAYREKAELLLALKPDIVVVQECEHPDILLVESKNHVPKDIMWFGDNINKGLAIISYNNYVFELNDRYNPDLKFIVPITVFGGQFEFTVFAVWTNNHEDRNNKYIEQVWKALNHYDQLLNSPQIIFTGDFNSNKIWDRKHKKGNHSAVVEKFAAKNIYSIYHKYFNQLQGEERDPTFFLQRNKDKPYHIDYCFTSTDFYDKVKNIEIGTFNDWISQSDHVPLIVDFDF